MNLNLKNKRALVCGSTQGIGKAVAVEFALLGADVTLLARNKESLQKVVSELYNDGKQKHNFIAADFSNPEEVKKQIENFISENGPVHILVNNTGGPPAGNVSVAKEEDFLKAFNAHLSNSLLKHDCR